MLPTRKPLILQGDCLEELDTLSSQSVQCCVTSPPYFGLRSYLPKDHPLKASEIGTEKTPEEFIAKLVAVFREVRRVLKDDGTLWVNIGDSYAANRSYQVTSTKGGPKHGPGQGCDGSRSSVPEGLKPKDLIGIPWRLAFALQADGWYLRQDIIWAKPNPMPESVKDRCTKAHEYVFLLSKAPSYYFDSEAIRNPPSEALLKQIAEGYTGADTKDFSEGGAQSASGTKARIIEGGRKRIEKIRGHDRTHDGFSGKWDNLTRAEQQALGSNKRSVWSIATKPYKGAHFATFPPELIRPCILAGSRPGDTVLDPFGGSGTTGAVAREEGRNSVLIELNPEYLPLIQARTSNV